MNLVKGYSTKEKYWREKIELVERLGGPYCLLCQEVKPYKKLTFHHPNERNGVHKGGFQHLNKVESDIENGEPVLVLCKYHHKQIHPHMNFKR